MKNLIVSGSPHIHTKKTTTSIMGDMVIALLPAAVASVFYFGVKALLMILVSTVTAVLSEALFNVFTKKKQTVGDLSAVVTGLLLSLSLPSKMELWQCALGALFAIVLVKCLFGGIGCNFANPAVTARIFLLLSFKNAIGGLIPSGNFADAVSGATPLELLKQGGEELPTMGALLLGNRGGAIGETCAVALLLGFLYLVIRKIISPYVPLVYMGTSFFFSLVLTGNPLYSFKQLFLGGLLFASIFMATDYSTTPLHLRGKCVFAFGCGILTILIRFYGAYPEGASFAILLMNILSPYIEKFTAKKPIGGKKHEK